MSNRTDNPTPRLSMGAGVFRITHEEILADLFHGTRPPGQWLVDERQASVHEIAPARITHQAA